MMAWHRTTLSDRLIRQGAEIVYQVKGTDRHDAKHELILFYKNEFHCFKREYSVNTRYYFRLDCTYDGVNLKFDRGLSKSYNTKVKDKSGELVDKVYCAAIKAMIRDEKHNVIKWYSVNADRRKTLITPNKYYVNSISIMDKYMINIEIEKMLTSAVVA